MEAGILLVGSFLSTKNGNRTTVEELADRLQGVGHPVFRTSSVHPRLLRLLDMLWVAFSQRYKYSFAYVEVYSGLAFIWAEVVCLLLRYIKKPFVLALHGGNLPVFARQYPERVMRLLQGARMVTAPSRYLQEGMHDYCENISLIPNPLELQHYPFRLRATPRPVFVWLRAFHRIYNPTLAVEVINRLQKIIPDIHLTMIGPDKGDGSLQDTQLRIERYSLKDQITIMPGIPKAQVPEVLAQADIFLNTTNVDNTPVSVTEAMACGLCVVSTSVGGLPYLLTDNHDALLSPAGETDAMAEVIHRLFVEPGLAERLSRNARQKAEDLDWQRILPQWNKLFDR